MVGDCHGGWSWLSCWFILGLVWGDAVLGGVGGSGVIEG
jgi:hypothetical protein